MHHATKTVTIRRPRLEVYETWRQFENLPTFMNHLRSVTDLGGGRSHWIASGPAGKEIEWDAEIVDEPGELVGPLACQRQVGAQVWPLAAGEAGGVLLEQGHDLVSHP